MSEPQSLKTVLGKTGERLGFPLLGHRQHYSFMLCHVFPPFMGYEIFSETSGAFGRSTIIVLLSPPLEPPYVVQS